VHTKSWLSVAPGLAALFLTAAIAGEACAQYNRPTNVTPDFRSPTNNYRSGYYGPSPYGYNGNVTPSPTSFGQSYYGPQTGTTGATYTPPHLSVVQPSLLGSVSNIGGSSPNNSAFSPLISTTFSDSPSFFNTRQ